MENQIHLGNHGCQLYFKQLHKSLVGPAREKKDFMQSLADNAETYLEEHPNADYEELCEQYGDPEDLAEEFATTASSKKTVLRHAKTNKRILLAVLVVAVITAAIVIFINAYDFYLSQSYREGYFVETIYEGIVSEVETYSGREY